jgi:hemolysin III
VATPVVSVAETMREQVAEVIVEVTPRLRGWSHLVIAPLTLAAGTILIGLSPTSMSRIGSTIFATSALVLFSVSAAMHRGNWSPRAGLLLRRLDHASIFLLIAGSYTPFSLLMLTGQSRVLMLTVAWGGAGLGIIFRLFWADAPRWLYTPIYMALGGAAVFFAGDFGRYAGTAVLVLMTLGGALYMAGGVVYGLRRPNPFPGWFGFHEVFHSLTVVAFAAHFAGVYVATYSLR